MAKTVEEIGGGGSSRKSGPISLQLVWNVCMQNVLEQLIAQSKLKNEAVALHEKASDREEYPACQVVKEERGGTSVTCCKGQKPLSRSF